MLRAGFALAVAFAVFGTAGSSRASSCLCYQWPVAPFNVPHPVRADFGDPRTVFLPAAHGDSLQGPGSFSFHNGVDIDAPNGTAVYPVESGVVAWVKPGHSVKVKAEDGRSFIYTHLATQVREEQAVRAGVTVLGHVKVLDSHLHLSEISASGRVVNPLLPNHLMPYSDTTRPVVAALQVRFAGKTVPPFGLHGRVGLAVDAYDPPMPVGDTLFPVTSFARERFGVVPAALTWSLSTLRGRTVIPELTPFDFRDRLPGNSDFWRVYARGTYQNHVWIKPIAHRHMPGKYLFWLTPSLDTTALNDGIYLVTVTAVDARGNRGRLVTRIEVRNHDRLLAASGPAMDERSPEGR